MKDILLLCILASAVYVAFKILNVRGFLTTPVTPLVKSVVRELVPAPKVRGASRASSTTITVGFPSVVQYSEYEAPTFIRKGIIVH